MSAEDPAARLAAALWPGGRPAEAYAVIDAARDPRTEALLAVRGLPHHCLNGADAGPELRAASPFLVPLDPAEPTTALLLREVWGRAWAIFAAAPVGTGLGPVERHFRRLLRVTGPGGRLLLFRYYDPRVLAGFLPTTDAPQRAQIFGPLVRLAYEAGEELRVLRPDGE